MKIWDERMEYGDNTTAHIQLPQKVYTMDFSKNMLVIGMDKRLIRIYDVRNFKKPFSERGRLYSGYFINIRKHAEAYD